MVIGTVLPFSAISGRSSLTLPSRAVLPPVNFLIASSASFLANAGGAPSARAPAAPAASAKASRRLMVSVIFVLRPVPEFSRGFLAHRAPEWERLAHRCMAGRPSRQPEPCGARPFRGARFHVHFMPRGATILAQIGCGGRALDRA